MVRTCIWKEGTTVATPPPVSSCFTCTLELMRDVVFVNVIGSNDVMHDDVTDRQGVTIAGGVVEYDVAICK